MHSSCIYVYTRIYIYVCLASFSRICIGTCKRSCTRLCTSARKCGQIARACNTTRREARVIRINRCLISPSDRMQLSATRGMQLPARNHGSLAGNGCVISRWILRIGENLRESVLRVDTFVDSSRLEINRFLGESGTSARVTELSFKAYWHG